MLLFICSFAFLCCSFFPPFFTSYLFKRLSFSFLYYEFVLPVFHSFFLPFYSSFFFLLMLLILSSCLSFFLCIILTHFYFPSLNSYFLLSLLPFNSLSFFILLLYIPSCFAFFVTFSFPILFFSGSFLLHVFHSFFPCYIFVHFFFHSVVFHFFAILFFLSSFHQSDLFVKNVATFTIIFDFHIISKSSRRYDENLYLMPKQQTIARRTPIPPFH